MEAFTAIALLVEAVVAGRFAEAVVEACGAVWKVSSSCSKAGVEEDVWVASKDI